nr:cell wall hydrolase [uncultured Sellimonas sp.]
MMKAKLKPFLRACTAFTCAAVLLASPVFVYAEDSVSDLEKETQDLQSQLQDLNEQLSSISGEITSLASEIESTNKKAEQAELDLAAAQVNEDLQYQAMKKRIQYIYENGNVSFLEILFTSDSMGEFLNRVDFVSNVTEYDRKMLKELQELRQDIDQKEKNLKKQKENLNEMKQQMTAKQAELNQRIESTSGELNASSQALAAARAAEEAAKKALETTTDSYHAAGTAELESGTSSDKKESSSSDKKQDTTTQTQKPAQNQKPSTGGSSSSSSNSTGNTSSSGTQKPSTDHSTTQKPSTDAGTTDLVLFAAILECEAGGSGYDGLLAVATVIMNRVASPSYPGTLKGVIYQSGQFSPTWNGSLNRVLARGPSSLCYQVARDALAGKRLASVSGCYQFRAASTGHSGTVVGGNVFF